MERSQATAARGVERDLTERNVLAPYSSTSNLADEAHGAFTPALTSPSQQQQRQLNTPQGEHYVDEPECYTSPTSIASRAATLAISSPPGARETTGGGQMADYNYGNSNSANNNPSSNGDVDGDMPMEDADPFNRQKYAQRPSTTTSTSSNRLSQYIPPDQLDVASKAAARYSPMNTSPTSPFLASPQQQQPQQQQRDGSTSYTPQQQAARYSPNKTAKTYVSPPQQQQQQQQRYYASPPSSAHPSQLPSLQQSSTLSSASSHYPQSATQQLNAMFGHEPQSPRVQQQQQQQHQANTGAKSGPPQFTKVTDVNLLTPRINSQPPFRRANPEGGFISPLQALTTHLPSTYRICNPGFQYESSRNPRRVLTKPSKGVKNDGFDNEDSDYILYVNDILGSEETNHKNRYLILDVLGQGTFGQVVKCQNLRTQEVVAVKVVKNKTAYFNQSMMEVSVLDLLNGRMDKNDDHHILRLKDTFIHRQHLCLVFELLSVNLYELIKQNQFRGLSTTLVRVFAQQLLNGLCLLSKAKLIHCDLKPENILLKNLESPIIKIIDFGSACDERQTVYTYIQSRFYRSPEVLLGLPYSAAIDMWSLGCIVVELFLGLPLFPGSSEYNQVSRITEMLGLPPNWMLEVGKQAGEFYEKSHDEFGRRKFRLKNLETYSREHGSKEQPSKKYFTASRLPEIIRTYNMPRKNMKPSEVDREMANREAFIDFAHGLLNINPLERWSPQQARTHPFITQQPFTGPFVPLANLKPGNGASNRSPAPGVQQQQQAEALSKQRAMQQQQHVQQQAVQAQQVQAGLAQQQQQQQAYGMHLPSPAVAGYPVAGHSPQAAMYGGNMYSPSSAGIAPPPYPSQPSSVSAVGALGYPQQPMPMVQQPPPIATAQPHLYPASSAQNPYANPATNSSSRRQRANTLDGPNNGNTGIPPALQRVVSHLDPNAPIRLQPSPAYYPPPPEGSDVSSFGNIGGRRRMSRALAPGSAGASRGQGERSFVRALEERTLEEGWSGGGGGWPGV